MNRVVPWARALGLGVLAFGVLAGCSKKDKDIDPPAELVKFAATVDVQKAWSVGTGGAEPVLRLALSPAVSGETVYAAGHGGDCFGGGRKGAADRGGDCSRGDAVVRGLRGAGLVRGQAGELSTRSTHSSWGSWGIRSTSWQGKQTPMRVSLDGRVPRRWS